MAITRIDTTQGGATGTSSFNMSAMDTTGADVIIVGLNYPSSVTTTVTDSEGNTYTALIGGTANTRAFFICKNPTNATDLVITVSISITSTINGCAAAYSGVDTSGNGYYGLSVVDSGTPPVTVDASPTDSNDFIISIFSNGTGTSPGSGQTVLEYSSGGLFTPKTLTEETGVTGSDTQSDGGSGVSIASTVILPNDGPDTTKPTFDSSEVNETDGANKLVIYASEPLDETSIPAASDFNIDSPAGISPTGTVTISGTKIVVPLDGDVEFGDTIQWDYTKGTNPIQDDATTPNEADSVTNQVASNLLLDPNACIELIDSGSGTGTTTAAVTIDTANAELIVVAAGGYGNSFGLGAEGVDSISDDQGNSYTLVEDVDLGASNLRLYICDSPNTAASTTITITIAGFIGQEGRIVAASYRGLDSTTLYYSNASAASSSVSASPTNSYDTIWSAGFSNNGVLGALGTDQVQQESVGSGSYYLTSSVEVDAGVGADTQSFTDAEAIVSVVIQGGTGCSTGDVTAPVLQTATVETAAPDEIVLTYDENLDETSVPATTDFNIDLPSGASVTNVDVTGTVVTLTLDTVIQDGDTVQIDYTSGTNPIQDLATTPNEAADLTNQSVTNNVSAPALQTATVQNAAPDEIVLTYDRTLDNTSTPATGDFNIDSPGGVGISSVVVSGTTVTLTLDTDIVLGDTVQIDYTQGVNELQDSNGVFADNLVNQAVTNNVAGVADTLHILRQTGTAYSTLPGTTWATPGTGIFPTNIKNDGSKYSYNSGTNTVTLPSSGLANGYLLIASVEFEDDSNGRHNIAGKFVQTSGTGNFVSAQTSGYSRDASEDRAYLRVWAFVDNPSAAAEFQFQWKRDVDPPTGGTEVTSLEVISMWYDNIGMYNSTSTTQPASATPTAITGWSSVVESDSNAIGLASDTFTLKSSNKKYFILGSYYWEGDYANRTQRLGGLDIDGVYQDHIQGYSYMRNASNNLIGEMISWVIERQSTDIDLQLDMWKGPDTGTFPNYGAPIGGTATGTNPVHNMVILELPDDAEVFNTKNNSQQSLSTAGTRVEVDISPSATFGINDATSFTRADDNGVNVEQDMEALLGANIAGGYASTTGARFTGYSEFTINGTGQTDTRSGDYARGDQGDNDTWGWSANLLSSLTVTSGQDVGVNAGKIAGGEGGTVAVLSGFAGMWGLNLDSIVPAVTPPAGGKRYFIIS